MALVDRINRWLGEEAWLPKTDDRYIAWRYGLCWTCTRCRRRVLYRRLHRLVCRLLGPEGTA